MHTQDNLEELLRATSLRGHEASETPGGITVSSLLRLRSRTQRKEGIVASGATQWLLHGPATLERKCALERNSRAISAQPLWLSA